MDVFHVEVIALVTPRLLEHLRPFDGRIDLHANVARVERPVAELGLAEPGLNRLIHEGYRLLNLITYFTAGPKEARAWTVRKGASAVEAAGVIHTDFARGFIRAEIIDHADYVALGGEQGAKDAGRMRLEGRDYRVRDGDVIHFRFNV